MRYLGSFDPVTRCWRPMYTLARSGIPSAARSPLPGLLGLRSGELWRCAPWHRSPGYDLRRAPYDHPDFTCNALGADWFSGSLGLWRKGTATLEATLTVICRARGSKESMRRFGFFCLYFAPWEFLNTSQRRTPPEDLPGFF
jgi:hypothetical protein